MNKVLTITAREYVVRLRSRGFIVATILGPVVLAVLMLAPIFVMTLGGGESTRRIAVVDQTGRLFEAIDPGPSLQLVQAEQAMDSLRQRVHEGTLDGYLVLPEALLEGREGAGFYSRGGGGLSFRFELQESVARAVRAERVRAAGASEEVIDLLQSRVEMTMNRITEEGETRDDTGAMSVVGYVMGFVIYMTIFIYGSLVMRGVIEEKTSRIMEVIVSSARPFQLMLGKVLGIGALGLTQMVVWLVMAVAVLVAGGGIAASMLDPAELELGDAGSRDAVLEAANITIPTIPAELVFYFLLFFVGGYLLYAALFAAVGSAVDQETDAQQFVLPVALPVILAIIFVGVVIDQPDSVLSIIVSLIPFFSPILMVVRLAVTHVPLWQSALSVFLLASSVVGTVWLAARIYRIGILMYGKKPGFRDLARWARLA